MLKSETFTKLVSSRKTYLPVCAGDANASSTRTLRVGIWPSTAHGGNPFVDRFSTELRNQNIEVIDVKVPEDAIGMNIDILHIHWPELIMRIEMQKGKSAFAIALAVKNAIISFATIKRTGVRLVWMIHNVIPHDLPIELRVVWFFYSRALARLVDAFITLSPATVAVVKKKLRGLSRKPSIGAWHPDFCVGLPSDYVINTDESGGRLYCSFGLLRPYKGFEDMIRSFKEFAGEADILKIAGQPYPANFGDKLSSLAGSDHRIEINPKHLSELELAVFVSEAHVIILPFRHYLHSGSLIYALSAKRPIITPKTPYAAALANEVGKGWIHTYSGRFDWREVSHCHAPEGSPRMSAFGDGVIGRIVESFYRSLVSR